MKLISATVRNYRIHRETTIIFDEQRSLIGGVNESGKSTLIEAIHRGLFLKSRVTGEIQNSMISLPYTGHPQVDIEFSVGEKTFRVTKCFSGSSGTTQLVEVNGHVWYGEEAESKLNILLKVDDRGGGRGLTDRIMQQWAHLWVWQGKGSSDPTTDTIPEHNAILQRLQEIGGAAIVQSDRDFQVANHFANRYQEIFTLNGKVRVGSNLDDAGKDCIGAEKKVRMCEDHMKRFEQTALEFERSEQAITEADTELNQLKQQIKQIARSIEHVTQLQILQNQQAEVYNHLKQLEKEQQDGSKAIICLRNEVNQHNIRLEFKRHAAIRLQNKREELQHQARAVSKTYQAAIQNTRVIRQHRDLAQVCLTRFELQDCFDKLSANFEKVSKQQTEIQEHQEALHKLPLIDENDLQSLWKIQEQLSNAQAALQAMAVTIEVIVAKHAIRIGTQNVNAGKKFHFSEPSDLWLGDSDHLRIQPGGGGSLEFAHQQVQKLQNELENQLYSYGIGDINQAMAIKGQRDKIGKDIAHLQSTILALDDGTLTEEYFQCKKKLDKVVAEIYRRTDQLNEYFCPATRAEALAQLDSMLNALHQADSKELEAKAQSDTFTTQLVRTEQDLYAVSNDLAENDRLITEKQAKIKLLIEIHGEDDKRTQAIQQTISHKQEAKAFLEKTRRELETLQPEQLERDQKRIARAITVLEEARQKARELRAVCQAALRLDGTEDPKTACLIAYAQVKSTQENLKHFKHQAEAIKLLHHFFQEQQKQFSDQLSQPLAEKISVYLQGLFGPRTQVSITIKDGTFRDIRLIRPTDNAFLSFNCLSGGTREQISAAVRLAMAEILAADHDGKLPVVFDDAFSYSDPERVRALQRMLDLAAERGLQVIILSCNPADYAGLGARLSLLDRVLR